MKITRIDTIPVRVPLRADRMIRSARGTHATSPFLLVKIYTDEDIVGLGEVSCTPRWSGEDHFTAQHFIQTIIGPSLIGEDPTRIEDLNLNIERGVARNPFTKAALEMALWDILGKSLGQPVYRLLGGAVRNDVSIKWSITGQEPPRAAEIASWAVQQGFAAMKVKVGLDPASDVERVAAVRKEIGSGIRLGVDANGGWPVRTALKIIPRLKEQDIFFVEQPVPAWDIAGMAQVRRRISLPVIADESVYTTHDAMALVRADAADVLSVYVGKAGGISNARKVVAVAEAAGVACTIGSNLEMGIGSAAMIHLAMATRGVRAEEFPCDIIGPLYYEDDLLVEPLHISDGKARPHERPGLGVELDEEKVRRYTVS
ncbi:MAG: mandelate racemase/muconate lactonizing enzyme family protein [Terriglobales bacterium]